MVKWGISRWLFQNVTRTSPTHWFNTSTYYSMVLDALGLLGPGLHLQSPCWNITITVLPEICYLLSLCPSVHSGFYRDMAAQHWKYSFRTDHFPKLPDFQQGIPQVQAPACLNWRPCTRGRTLFLIMKRQYWVSLATSQYILSYFGGASYGSMRIITKWLGESCMSGLC